MSGFFGIGDNTEPTIQSNIDSVRTNLAVGIGKVVGYYGRYKDKLSEQEEKAINELYAAIHGITDDIPTIRGYVQQNSSAIIVIQKLFDLRSVRMGRATERVIVDENRAILFIHSLLTENIADFTEYGVITDAELATYFSTGNMPSAMLPESKPFGQLGGKKRTRKSKKSKSRKSRKSRK